MYFMYEFMLTICFKSDNVLQHFGFAEWVLKFAFHLIFKCQSTFQSKFQRTLDRFEMFWGQIDPNVQADD